MDIVLKKIAEIKPYEKNPRKNEEAVKYVAESIKQFGFKVPIVIDKDGIIVAGHTRYKAAKKLNLKEVPCIVADDLTEEQVKAFRLADNKVAEKAEWDFDLLAGELDDLFDFDMTVFGFEEETEDEPVEVVEDDYEIAPPEEPKAKRGDIYKLGNHRLMCGDMHPDKVADRIAGAVVDIAYAAEENPKVAVEVLIGHGVCHIIVETSAELDEIAICQAVHRITGRSDIMVDLRCVKQDVHLNRNQQNGFKCGDNGIFKGVPLTDEQKALSKFAREVYTEYPTDGKYILDGEKLVVCQSHARSGDLKQLLSSKFSDIFTVALINPLGDWTGGTDVDTGATNRKLGSDMADSVTGGGLHGKDLSKADVSANIYAFRKAQETGEVVSLSCAIGDTHIDGVPYEEIVEQAREYITSLGGFEKFAEWGLV